MGRCARDRREVVPREMMQPLKRSVSPRVPNATPTPRACSAPADTVPAIRAPSEASQRPEAWILAFVRWYNHHHKLAT